MSKFVCAYPGCTLPGPHGHSQGSTHPWVWWPDDPEFVAPKVSGPPVETIAARARREALEEAARAVAALQDPKGDDADQRLRRFGYQDARREALDAIRALAARPEGT